MTWSLATGGTGLGGGVGMVSDLHRSVGCSSPGSAVCRGQDHSSVGHFEIQECPGRGRHLPSAQPAGQKDQGPGLVTAPSPCALSMEDLRTVLATPAVKPHGPKGREHTEMGGRSGIVGETCWHQGRHGRTERC